MSFKDALAEYPNRHLLDADDIAHFERWVWHIDDTEHATKLWDELPWPQLIIERALDARKEARAAQADPSLLLRQSQERHDEAIRMAECAEAIARYYRNQDKLAWNFWWPLREALRSIIHIDTEHLIQLHEREAVVFRETAPRIDTTPVPRQSRGPVDPKSREKKTFLIAMEGWLKGLRGHTTDDGEFLEGKLSATDDDLLAAMANIALDRDDITREDIKVARKPTTRAARRRKANP